MNTLEKCLEKATAFHGDRCPGIIMGTRMTIAGLHELGLSPENPGHDLIVYVEIDRCATDAVQAITGCSLGHRTLKHMNYGKFAVTFINTATGKAVRVAGTPKDKVNKGETDFKKIGEMLLNCPEEDIFTITPVKVEIPKDEMPGTPNHRAVCSVCHEEIMDGKEVIVDGKAVCKNCNGTSYYSV